MASTVWQRSATLAIPAVSVDNAPIFQRVASGGGIATGLRVL